MTTRTTGDIGERLAAEELMQLGYKILDRNWKTRAAEIDIVAQKNGVVCFVEVKYRATTRQGDGFDYITDAKLRHMIRAAEIWVAVHNWQGEYTLLAASVNGAASAVSIREIA
jgi:putative endonuclease